MSLEGFFSRRRIDSSEVMDMGKKFSWAGMGAALGMLILILDAKTASAGAAAGLELCIYTVIPALFPFFVLSILLTGTLTGQSLPLLRPLGNLCGVPQGAESLLLAGALGGYPVGAQCVALAYASGALEQQDARRMLGFCNNAGPSFLFGMGSVLFDSPQILAVLWGIGLLSAILTGALLPGKSHGCVRKIPGRPSALPEAVSKSISALAGVCGWVILLRVVLAFLDRWLLWLLPPAGRTVVFGILELTNGFAVLTQTAPLGLRFVLCSGFLSFGGICVLLQTSSVTSRYGLDLGLYLPGKILQACISVLWALIAQTLVLPPKQWCRISPVSGAILGAALLAVLFSRKKAVAFSGKLVYNTEKTRISD